MSDHKPTGISAPGIVIPDTTEALLFHLEHLRECLQPIQPTGCVELRRAFSSRSAHVRAKAIDVLALRAGPRLWFGTALAGELVLWHTQDPDARVRDRAFHCLLVWTSPPNRPGPTTSTDSLASLRTERLSWIHSNLEAVYSAACHGLLDVEEMVRRTSLHFLAQLSLTRPHHRLEEVPPSVPVLVGAQPPSRPPLHTEEVRLVDDAFRRVCIRLQDPARQVRQLAAQILADLAQTVTEDSLVLTLEKTVMSDRQVRRRSMLDQSSTPSGANRCRSEQWNSSARSTVGANANTGATSSSNTLNLIATGSNGAIISGLEDDYFEVRCATLATVTHVASLSAQFAANCQDLLVDMLTDDIQDVRLAAIRALGAVGDQVPLQSEQVAIITSALAEGSGRIRRRLHQLLSRCCLASAPCLISLLDGLLHNLRRYPQDRDSLWRCAASVGRRHSVFVETCLPSLLRTHLWLSGPEPNWEDPAYLTVLLLVLNAEPGAAGMQAQFPRHLAATRVYLTELVPSLLPKRRHPFDAGGVALQPSDRGVMVPTKRRRLEFAQTDWTLGADTALQGPSDSPASESLLRFLHSLICRVVHALTDVSHPFLEASTNALTSPSPVPSHGMWTQRLALLTRLVFADLCGSVQRLDRAGQWNGLVQWLTMLTTLGWCLASVGAWSDLPRITSRSGLMAAVSVVPLMRKPGKLLSRALLMGLRALYLFSGKTNAEQMLLMELVVHLVSLRKLISLEGTVTEMSLWARTVQSVIQLLSESTGVIAQSDDSERDPSSVDALHRSAKRLQPVYVALLQPVTAVHEGTSAGDSDVFGFGRIPAGTASFANRLSEDADDGWAPASRVAADQVITAVPEVRFTATIGTASIRVRAVIVGMSLPMARQRVCVLFRRPDLPVCAEPSDGTGISSDLANSSSDVWTALFHQWWPPAGAWHPLDEGFSTTAHISSSSSSSKSDRTEAAVRDESKANETADEEEEDVNRVELRTHLELSAGRWSDAGTVEIGLGYCLPSSHLATPANQGEIDACSAEAPKASVVIPLIPRKMLARVKLVPSAPVGQW